MNILIVSATDAELKSFQKQEFTATDTLITGVGMVNTVYAIMQQLQKKHYDILLQVGICGAFDRRLVLGEVTVVKHDMFADLGAEDNAGFTTVFEMGLMEPDAFPFTDGKIFLEYPVLQCLQNVKKVEAITVNTVHGNEQNIMQAEQKFKPQIETMEGAAFAFVSRMQNIPAIQLRAVSNYIEKRNKANWKIDEAVANLHKVLAQILKELTA